jgi:serine/threonine protein kinase
MVDDDPTEDLVGPNLEVDLPPGPTAEDPVTQERVPAAAPVRPSPANRAERIDRLAGRAGDRYQLGVAIGVGGMGEILAANDDQFDREVAVKRMKDKHPSEHAMGRFFREARIQGQLDHPAIVPVHELGVDADGRPFFTMKKLSGTTLTQRIAGDAPRQRLLRAFADVCLAIEFAHKRGVVHRDIKPDNIVLGEFGEVYVLDWGVAKVMAETEEEVSQASEPRPILAERMTVDGTVIGTRAYMAPEQARATKDVDGRADVYSLGCVLYEILTGVQRTPKPEPGHKPDPVEPRPSARAPHRDIPPELDQVVLAATHEDRAARIQTPRELGERVQRYLDGDRDLALRQQLARMHLEAARAAFEAGDDEHQRRTSMREAGRSLALDPKLAGAAELVSRLMLEPPRERPPEMQKMMDADNLETLRRLSKAGALAYLGFLGFLPLVLFGGKPGDLAFMAALCAVVALNIGFLLPDWTYRNMKARAVRIAIGNALLIALVARIGSPFVIAPAVAALSTMNLVFSPNYKTPRAALLLAAAISGAVLVTALVEVVGLLPPTFHFTETTMVIESSIIAIAPGPRAALLAFFVVAIVAAAAGMAFQNRKTERIVRERLHLQAWQLRQLVS